MPIKYFTGQQIPIKLSPEIGALGGTITSPKILYSKPDGTEGEWTATLDGEYISYTTLTTDINIPNTWSFQAKYLNSGKVQYGQKIYETFGEPITP